MKDSKTIYIVIIAALCLILFCSILVVFGVLSLNALPMTFLGAAMGAVITGVITLTLLQGQQTGQEVKERNVMIFQKKLEIFKEFIDMVWEIWTEKKITAEQYQKLTSFYYKNLMIYISDEEKYKIDGKKEKGSGLSIIGDSILQLGDCLELDKETPSNTFVKLQKSVIDIINTLSKELDLGGQIDPDQIKKHTSNKLLPAMFRKRILDSFNELLVLPNSAILEKGQWEKWNEGPIIHDDLIFDFKGYPKCSIKIGFSKDANGHISDDIIIIFFVPRGADYNRFNDFRAVKKGIVENRIRLGKRERILGKSSQDNENIPQFNFFDDDKIKEICEKSDNEQKQIAKVLAQRTSAVFKELKIRDKNDKNDLGMSFAEFLEEHYRK